MSAHLPACARLRRCVSQFRASVSAALVLLLGAIRRQPVGVAVAGLAAVAATQTPVGAPRFWGAQDNRTVTTGYDFNNPIRPARARLDSTFPSWYVPTGTGVTFTNLGWVQSVGGRFGGSMALVGPGTGRLELRLDNKAAGVLLKRFWVSFESYSSDPSVNGVTNVQVSADNASRVGHVVVSTQDLETYTPPSGPVGRWTRSTMLVTIDPCPDWEKVTIDVAAPTHGEVAFDRIDVAAHCEPGVDFRITYTPAITPQTVAREELFRRAARMWSERLRPPAGVQEMQIELDVHFVPNLGGLAGQTTAYVEQGGRPHRARISVLDSLNFSGPNNPGQIDALTVVLHEMGHALGLIDTSPVVRQRIKSANGRHYLYDATRPPTSDHVADVLQEGGLFEHLLDRGCLMGRGIVSGERRTITEKDLEVLRLLHRYTISPVGATRSWSLGHSCVQPGPFVFPDRQPLPGQRFGLQFGGAAPGSFGLALFGFSHTDHGSFGLPFSLQPFGSSCEIAVSPMVVQSLPFDVGGNALVEIDLPAGPGFLGARLYGQALTLDASAAMLTSNTAELQFEATSFQRVDGFDVPFPRQDLVSNTPVALPGGWVARRDPLGAHGGQPGYVEVVNGVLTYRGGAATSSDAMFLDLPLSGMPATWMLRMRVTAAGECSARGQLHLRDLGGSGFLLDVGPQGRNLNGVVVPDLALATDVPYWIEVRNGQLTADLRVWPVGTERPLVPVMTADAVGALSTLRFIGANYCAPAMRLDWLQVYSD
ncbi:MAG: hypothetical protein IPK26_20730 [Planctomycetes bacterium]|nr:hypothetical protein [Planctomycetota bacterium]